MKTIFISLIILISISCNNIEKNETNIVATNADNNTTPNDTSLTNLLDTTNKFYAIVYFGLPEPEKNWFFENINEMLTQKYGFVYRNGGCVSNYKIDSITKIKNDSVKNMLKKRNGEDWWERYEEESEQLRQSIDSAVNRKNILWFQQQQRNANIANQKMIDISKKTFWAISDDSTYWFKITNVDTLNRIMYVDIHISKSIKISRIITLCNHCDLDLNNLQNQIGFYF